MARRSSVRTVLAIMGSRQGYDALKQLVVELAAGKQIAEDLPPHAQPWVLHKGICAPSEHNDSADGGHFSLLVCQN